MTTPRLDLPGRRGRTAFVLAAAVLGGACSTTLTVGELDALNRSIGAKTVLVGSEYTLYSPFEYEHTEPWLAVLDREFAAVRDFFAGTETAPIAVLLDPIATSATPVRTDSISVQDLVLPEGLLGWAERDSVVIRVSPVWKFVLEDGREIPGVFSAESYADTVRHEFAHAFAERRGLEGERWFNEGVAELVESMRSVEGALTLGDPGDELRGVARLPAAERRLGDVLDWRSEDPDLAEQPPWRPLAHAFVRFLLTSVPRSEWIPRLHQIAQSSRATLLSHEAAWESWLAGLARH